MNGVQSDLTPNLLILPFGSGHSGSHLSLTLPNKGREKEKFLGVEGG